MPFGPFSTPSFSLRNLQEELNSAVERVFHGDMPTGILSSLLQFPVIDLHEFPDRYVLFAEVPGLAGDEIDVSYLDNALTLRGERKCPIGEDEDAVTVRGERRFGKFSRTVELPTGIEADQIAARCHNGVLAVSVPKSSSASPRSVKVKVDEG